MATNKIVLRTTEQFMSDYTPTYQSIYPLFLAQNAQAHTLDVGKVDFRRIETVGDIRAKHVQPKDTVLHMVNATDMKKTFAKYFKANQFVSSQLQSTEGAEDVFKQVLDEMQLQADEMMLFGEGTSAGNVLNNGLFYSADSNYDLESSAEIPTTDRLAALHSKIVSTLEDAKNLAGDKILLYYGDALSAQMNSLYPEAARSFKGVLREALEGDQVEIVQAPKRAIGSTLNGWIVVNKAQILTHYIRLPELFSNGVNEEKMHTWANFLMGSMMVEVKAKSAIIHQPITFAV